MKLYTKSGDRGTTSLFNGERVSKDNIRVTAYGTLDECNSALGVACSILSQEVRSPLASTSKHNLERLETLLNQLKYIQHRFFDLGAHLATPRVRSDESTLDKTRFEMEASNQLEEWIDELQERLPPLTTFILPGGHPAAAHLHLARTTARRAERISTALIEEDEVEDAAYVFLNRVSDYFFVAARYANHIFNIEDVTWHKLS
uniref:Corrinoid adenosyltransferase MMAB n=1 Tax=Rhodosorus marinus TaxID=101924 RepID=A0A7S0G3P1_9RHOD|mmetsp:Transcript_1630/g.2502  ORF Transcript_1630/g.2502 Transcript_1630/m.2502 type:complete len:203 (+) Transcript_1630:300-908(+)